MPKYYFLYYNPSVTRSVVFQADVTRPTEEEARELISKTYNAIVIKLRKGRQYSSTEINKTKTSLKY